MKQIISILFLVLLFASACNKRIEPVPATNIGEKSSITLSFNNVVNGSPMVLKDVNYLNANGDTFTVTAYKYYISNIKFTGDDGTVYSEPESYHLIDEEKSSSKTFVVKNIPAGNYVKVSFLIGVDSEKNVSGAHDGALDLANGMFWDWNSGYIMAKFEGRSPQSDSKFLTFHIGGYSGPNNVLRWVNLSLPTPAIATNGKNTSISIRSDAAEWFKNPSTIEFFKFSLLMSPGSGASGIADNYADMFTIDHIE